MRSQLKSTVKSLRSRPGVESFRIQEQGARSKEWRGRLRICLIYPHTYYVGMSNLGFQQIYSLWNDIDEVVCERAFLSENSNEIRSFESGRALKDFDVLAFSLSFENDAIHVLRILKQAGLALKSVDRTDADPVVLMGGAAISMNPMPLLPFIDAFAFGDGEEIVFDIAKVLRGTPFMGHRRMNALEALSEIQGIYVPALHGHLPGRAFKRRTIKFINSYLTKTEIVTNHTEFSNNFMVEVSRGCPQRCRFCSVSYTEASTRFRRLSFLKSAFDEGIERVGRVGLVGAALADHPELVEMANYVVDGGGEISLSSLRVEAVSSKLMDLLNLSSQRTLTLALETGSQRLQQVIHKRTDEAKVMHCVETALKAGIRNLKFYFIIGLPTETRADVEEAAELIRRIHSTFMSISKSRGQMGNLSVSLNPFIPKPTTPFEACAHLREDELEARFLLFKSKLSDLQNFHLNHEGWDTAQLQSLLSVGDERVSDFLLETHHRGDDWRSALKSYNHLMEEIVYRPKTLSETLPWSFITK